MAEPIVIGLDISLTCLGWAAAGKFGTVQPGARRGMERLAYIRDCVRSLLVEVRPSTAIVEGYSFGSQGRSVFNLGEVGGVVRLLLHDRGVPYVDIPPGTLKIYATSSGAGKKGGVIAAAAARLGYVGGDDNICDALWLEQMGLTAYGCERTVQVPQTHMRALKNVKWPDLPGRALAVVEDGNVRRARAGGDVVGKRRNRRTEDAGLFADGSVGVGG